MASDYQHYTAKDFALDESFKQWVRNPENAELASSWEQWIRQHPEKSGEIAQAKQLIALIHFKNESPSPEEIQQAWNKVSAKVDSTSHKSANEARIPKKGRPRKNLFFQPFFRAAAVVGLLLVAGFVLFSILKNDKYTVHQTAYGKTQSILLPDSSKVTLNAHSTLRYPVDWDSSQPSGEGQNVQREVWLEGEAYFDVKNKGTDRKFIVHSGQLEVEVLGTAFNVDNRRDRTQVVLSEGKVRINPLRKLPGENTMIMNPGDMVEYQNDKLTKRVVNPEVYTSWRNNKMVFDGFKLSRVARMLEDTYGVNVKIQSEELANRRFKGTFPSDDMEILLKALSETFDIQITKKKNQIFMKNQSKTDQ